MIFAGFSHPFWARAGFRAQLRRRVPVIAWALWAAGCRAAPAHPTRLEHMFDYLCDGDYIRRHERQHRNP